MQVIAATGAVMTTPVPPETATAAAPIAAASPVAATATVPLGFAERDGTEALSVTSTKIKNR